MIRAALLGAVLVHPILFVVAFLKGMVLGANPSFGGGPQSDYVFGWQGGLVSMEELFFVYFITIGIALVIITVAGVVWVCSYVYSCACWFGTVLQPKKRYCHSESLPNQPPRPHSFFADTAPVAATPAGERLRSVSWPRPGVF